MRFLQNHTTTKKHETLCIDNVQNNIIASVNSIITYIGNYMWLVLVARNDAQAWVTITQGNSHPSKLLVLRYSTDAVRNHIQFSGKHWRFLTCSNEEDVLCSQRGSKILFAGWTEAHYLTNCESVSKVSVWAISIKALALYVCTQETHTISNQLMSDTAFLTFLNWAKVKNFCYCVIVACVLFHHHCNQYALSMSAAYNNTNSLSTSRK